MWRVNLEKKKLKFSKEELCKVESGGFRVSMESVKQCTACIRRKELLWRKSKKIK